MRQISVIHVVLLAGCLDGLVQAQTSRLFIDSSQPPVRLGITGTPGERYVLEQHSILAADDGWEPLISLTLTQNSQTWTDSASSVIPQRFYRLRALLDPPQQFPAADFRLIDHTGRSHELNRYSTSSAIVMVFVNGLNGISPSLLSSCQSLRDDFASQGAEFWWIDSNLESDRAAMPALAEALGVQWPVLHDRMQLVARAFGVTATPEVVCLNPTDWTIFYRGAIDDRTSAQASSATQPYLALALKSFLQGQPVTFTQTRPSGTLLRSPPATTASYSSDIAPLLQDKCVSCHSPGNIAPWAMTNYAVVRQYSSLIKHQVLTSRMPPWHADPAHGDFSNDLSLKPDEAARLMQWIADGSPRGDGPDRLAEALAAKPAPTDYPNAWPIQLGQPDYVVSIPRQNIPATGEVPYQYVQVTANVPSNVWLRAAVVLPGNARVVHHALVFNGSLLDVARSGGGLNGYFSSYVPGQRALEYPAGSGRRLARNATLTFQMHYTPTGQAETDQSRLGLYFMKSPPPFELQTGAAVNLAIVIPPGEREYEREALVIPSPFNDVWLYELAPHMHYRGARFSFEANYPDGTREVLLSVPKYDFHWQTLYRLAQPKRLPAGTVIRCRGAFDNSAQNEDNPDPHATVRFGEQTDDEMFIGYLNYAVLQ